METQTSTSGKGLGMAALIIGIITFIWSIIPIVGATAFWPAIIGLLLGIASLIMAIRGNNPKKGIIIAGVVLCLIAVGISCYWVMALKTAAEAFNGMNIK